MTRPRPRLVPTPAPAWRRRTAAIIVGSGAAGLSAALHLAAADIPAVLLTRAALTDGASDWAQGGLAAVWAADDSPASHLADTLIAGAGLCEPAAVRQLVEGAPEAIRRLIGLGARFDRDDNGAYDLHLEGGHSARRILHAGGDASGHEVERALSEALRRAVREGSSVEVVEQMRAVDVLVDRSGRAYGVRVRQSDGTIGEWLAPAVVLASGGIGQIWPLTTNPTVATGDGVAMAYRAGAMLRDLEFVQFHPTVLWIDPVERVLGDRGVLVSEAVRGEGAVLIDHRGERVMAGVHPLADLAPRDVVSAAMQAHMTRTGRTHLYLDARHFGERTWAERFPSILAMCRERGIDPVDRPIPVRPGAHYLCGGVAADLDGRTSMPGLYAVGEVAATGVQGANRLASNSVTEALVAGDRVGALLAAAALTAPSPSAPAHTAPPLPVTLIDPAGREELRTIMDQGVEVARTAEALTFALRRLDALSSTPAPLDDAVLDMTNMHTVATLVATAALARNESRGCHRRADHPAPAQLWQRHVCLSLGPDGEPALATRPLGEDPDNSFAARPSTPLQEALA